MQAMIWTGSEKMTGKGIANALIWFGRLWKIPEQEQANRNKTKVA